ncbi:MAG: hypothetical protein AUJ58_11250 [Zetaproteobacteria bacterium CG1_02_55_237]|nr:MAG: hypothetical protein AUJ58_11250 [Zetaproteobacteria bacterium CG1_02_55_237]
MGSEATTKIIGLALAVLGIDLAIWGYQLSDSIESEVTQAITGSDTDKVMTFYIAGAVSFVVGLYLSAKK